MPIIALSPHEKTYQQLALNWGVIPVLCKDCKTVEQAFKEASHYALTNLHVSYGDLVVLTSGSPFWVRGTTNTLRVESIGDVLVRGHSGFGAKVHANITLVPTSDSKKPYEVRDLVIVIASYDESFAPLVREAAGVILQNDIEDTGSEKELLSLAKTLHKPTIIRGDGAFRILREGQLVTLDPEKAHVYKGAI
jgi:pyruvate kinase